MSKAMLAITLAFVTTMAGALKSPDGGRGLIGLGADPRNKAKARKWNPHGYSEDTMGRMLNVTDPYCNCQNWSTIFAHAGAACGMGMELSNTGMGHRKQAATAWDSTYCNAFLKRFNENSCINANMGHKKGGEEIQWCYVKTSRCGEYNGAQTFVPPKEMGGYAMKLCKAGQDKILADQTPDALQQKAKKYKVDIGFLAHLAYPTVQGAVWEDHAQFWSGNEASMSVFAKARAQEQSMTGKPVIWEHNSSNSFSVTMGSRAWTVTQKVSNHKLHELGLGSAGANSKALLEMQDKLTKMTSIHNNSHQARAYALANARAAAGSFNDETFGSP